MLISVNCSFIYTDAVLKHPFEKEYQLTGAIKKELGLVLPAYMIPRKFSYHKELPITPNGKVDRKEIREKVLL